MSDTPPSAPPPPPPGHPPQSPGQQRVHPLAVVSLVLSVLGFFPLLIIGGLIGAPLGAVAVRSIRRQPERYRGAGLAVGGLVVGMVSGVLVLATFGVVRADDWGWIPFITTISYGALVVGLAAAAHTGAGRAGGVAAFGAAGTVVAVLGIIGLVFLIALLFTVIGEAFLDAILGRD